MNPNPLEFKGLLARSSTASSVSENEYILPEEFKGKMALTITQGFALPKKELAIYDGDPLEYYILLLRMVSERLARIKVAFTTLSTVVLVTEKCFAEVAR